jgi:hypothetical protein
MLISMNPMRVYELCALLAKLENKYVVCIDNTKYHYLLSEEDKVDVKNYYLDIISETEYEEIFDNDYTFYEFTTQAYAIEKCAEWFPAKSLVDEKYWIYVYVVAPDGTVPHDNSFIGKKDEN